MDRRTLQPRRRARSSAVSLALVVGVSSLTTGCSQPLLSPEEPRSQYDRYDAVRSQFASQYTEDEFGRRRPNLRARLLPKE